MSEYKGGESVIRIGDEGRTGKRSSEGEFLTKVKILGMKKGETREKGKTELRETDEMNEL